ncbi:hypothetical protein [Ekhidna sp. To15]|uniref:hypothetical protein n=1 Tax=Ekhidna sp. To15 TaxID=3395267 RepID=UPI003F51EFC1
MRERVSILNIVVIILLLTSCSINRRYYYDDKSISKPAVFIEPIIDVRYSYSITSINNQKTLNGFIKDYETSILLKKKITEHLQRVSIDSANLKPYIIDSLTLNLPPGKLIETLRENYGSSTGIDYYFPKYEKVYDNYLEKNNFKGAAIFVYIFQISLKRDPGLGKALGNVLLSNDDVPYLEGFVGIYNFDEDIVEYYYELSEKIDLVNNFDRDIDYLISRIYNGLPQEYTNILSRKFSGEG